MTIKQRIIEYLQIHPEGIDDDMLAQNFKIECKTVCKV